MKLLRICFCVCELIELYLELSRKGFTQVSIFLLPTVFENESLPSKFSLIQLGLLLILC
jgi:hypothetical protein